MSVNVSPTKSKLIETKRSLALAKEGHTLLDKKRNVLVREMMRLIDSAKEVQEDMETIFAEAYESLQKANLSIGIEHVQEVGIAVEEVSTLSIRLKSIMGVEIPEIDEISEGIEPSYGFVKTNANLDRAYKSFKKALSLIARLAEIETKVYRLAREIKKTQRRVNALENILIPQYEETVKFIESYIEETERDDFFRMKRLKGKK
ncbi:V-type ATP synthase subunit D [Mesoaciditoga lauensis]|uniref:V-type ATP synthase subunit D n=1 Tax=Mesoaciditoga lauensis TaxID=1495039 RepID=UPI00056D4BFE|nr:V-type ATP synthase subunit D [Mesoaciditoga lauensis]